VICRSLPITLSLVPARVLRAFFQSDDELLIADSRRECHSCMALFDEHIVSALVEETPFNVLKSSTRRHSLARFRAASACFCAAAHRFVVPSHARAALLTRATDLCTDAAHTAVKLRAR
jgi:hypothetical protein